MSTEKTRRYTAEQMREKAESYTGVYGNSDMYHMLRQAADDAESYKAAISEYGKLAERLTKAKEALAAAEADAGKDAERWRWLVNRVFYTPHRFRCIVLEYLSLSLRGKIGQSGGDLLTECVDAARNPTKEG